MNDIRRYPYRIPAEERRGETKVSNSRFIASVAPVFSGEEARRFIARMRDEFSDATHNVPAFIIGGGSSLIEHCSDDGEPAGTAGRPVLTVLKGSGLGDIVVVVSRYFGGTKLGTGGLVRAYSGAARAVLEGLKIAEKIPTCKTRCVVPYSLFERVRTLVIASSGVVLAEEFSTEVLLTAQFKVEDLPGFQDQLRDLSNGSIQVEVTGTNSDTLFPAGVYTGSGR